MIRFCQWENIKLTLNVLERNCPADKSNSTEPRLRTPLCTSCTLKSVSLKAGADVKGRDKTEVKPETMW